MRRQAIAILAVQLAFWIAACAAEDDPCASAADRAPWLAFESRRTGNYDIFLVRDDGSCLRQLTSDPGADLSPAWSPSGALAYASDRGGGWGIRIFDPATGHDAPLELGVLSATLPAWSPDGRSIAFEGRAPGQSGSDVYLVAAEGGAPTRLTDGAGTCTGPAWSRDGEVLYFVSSATGRFEVHALAPADCLAMAGTCSGAPVTSGSRIVGRPSVSPDGRRLAFGRTVLGSSETEVVTLDLATGAILVLSGPGDSEPAFTPAGNGLVLRSYRYGNPELVLVDASGAETRRLTSDPAPDGAPACAPLR